MTRKAARRLTERDPEWATFGACLGATIRMAREDAFASQAELAKAAGWPQSKWSRLETDASRASVADVLTAAHVLPRSVCWDARHDTDMLAELVRAAAIRLRQRVMMLAETRKADAQ